MEIDDKTTRYSKNTALYLFVILSIADVVTTLFVLNKGGLEGNPFSRMAMDQGMGFAIFMKAMITLMFVSVITFFWKYENKRQFLTNSSWFIVGVLFMTVLGNVIVIFNYWM